MSDSVGLDLAVAHGPALALGRDAQAVAPLLEGVGDETRRAASERDSSSAWPTWMPDVDARAERVGQARLRRSGSGSSRPISLSSAR